jgi:hypothetical protein
VEGWRKETPENGRSFVGKVWLGPVFWEDWGRFSDDLRASLFFPVLDLCPELQAGSHDLGLLLIGISLASVESTMSEIASPSTYNEPTVMWRMTHRDGRWAQAVLDPLPNGARVQWFVNGHSLAVADFADWTGAIEWSNRLRAQQWTVGWRLSDDIPDPPARRKA